MRRLDRQVFDVCNNYASKIIMGNVSPCILAKYSKTESVIEVYRIGSPKIFGSSLAGRVSIVEGGFVSIDPKNSSQSFRDYFSSQMQKKGIQVTEKYFFSIE